MTAKKKTSNKKVSASKRTKGVAKHVARKTTRKVSVAKKRTVKKNTKKTSDKKKVLRKTKPVKKVVKQKHTKKLSKKKYTTKKNTGTKKKKVTSQNNSAKKQLKKEATLKKNITPKKKPRLLIKKIAHQAIPNQGSAPKTFQIHVKTNVEQRHIVINSLGSHDKTIHATPRQAKKKVSSEHILDLREISLNKRIDNSRKTKYANTLNRFEKEIKEKKQTFSNISKKVYSSLPRRKQPSRDIPDFHYPRETQVFSIDTHSAKLKGFNKNTPVKKRTDLGLSSIKKIKLVNLKLPSLSISSFSFPRISLPSLKFPSFRAPIITVKTKITSYNPFKLSPYAIRAIISFVLVSFTIVSPLMAYDYYQTLVNKKGEVLGVTYQAIDHLKKSQVTNELDDILSAKYELSEAHDDFVLAKNELENINPLVSLIIKALPQQDELETATNLLSIATLATDIGQDILNILDSNDNESSLTDRLQTLITTLEEKKDDIHNINTLIDKINIETIPPQYRQRLQQSLEILPVLDQHIDDVLSNSKLLIRMLGGETAKRYLLIFQNNNEIRPTGGFIGSFAEADIDQGKLVNIRYPHGGSYDLRAGLKVNVEPPKPISILNSRWEFQDANFFPDFKKSAEKILWFYRKSGGTTVDGLISINATFIENILDVTGPIFLPEYNLEVTSQNFLKDIQYAVERGPDKEAGKPKKILGELLSEMMKRIVDLKTISLTQLLTTFEKGLNEKEIQVYFQDNALQNVASEQNWTGELLSTNGDYLNIISTNIAGGKTNTHLSDNIDVKVVIKDSGEIVNTVTITRTHNGQLGNPINGVKNNDYIRFYVPLHSKLISAKGFNPIEKRFFRKADYETKKDFDLQVLNSIMKIDEGTDTEIYQDQDKTVFANWMQISVGETKTVSITYSLPFTIYDLATSTKKPKTWLEILRNEFSRNDNAFKKYSLLLQKQSGKVNQNYNISIFTPQSLEYVWAYPSDMIIKPSSYSIKNFELTQDSIFGLIFETP